MKGIGKILLYVLALLALVGLIWVSLTPGATSPEIDQAEWMGKPVTGYMIIVALIALVITTIIFIIYKVLDLVKHPSHMRETFYVIGAIIISAIIGFIFSGSEDVVTPLQTVSGSQSKLIGTGIIMTGVLLFAGLIFLIWDTIKALIKT